MYTMQILFDHSLDLYGGNCVSDFLMRPYFSLYAKNQETFKKKTVNINFESA